MTSVLTETVARLLLAPVLMVALAILVKGYADVGDGFSAGAVAALGVALQYMALGRREAERLLPLRLLPAMTFVGLLAAVAVAFVPLLTGEALLEHRPAPGAEVVKLGTAELITAVAFDVAVFVLVVGAAVAVLRVMAREQEEGSRE